MSDRPAPPVPAECTMGGNDWFPWYFDRLRKSKWWRRASDMARARNVMLWGEAYKAVPAGSLADDDDDLAEAAGFGMDVAAFAAAKAEIMAAWTLCSDGRWYHPTVCEVVLERWENTSERRKAAAAKKRAQREKARGVPPESARVPPNGPNVPGDISGNGGDNASLTRAREQDKTGEEKTEEDPHTPNGGQDMFGLDPEPDEPVDEVVQAFDLWNDTAGRLGLPKAKDLTDGRRRAIRKRLETAGVDGWRQAVAAIEVSAFLRGLRPGRNGQTFKADIDFVSQAKSFQRLREGFYGEDADAPRSAGEPAPAHSPWPGRMREWRQNRFWKDLDWGPRPGKPGCEVPAEYLAEPGRAA